MNKKHSIFQDIRFSLLLAGGIFVFMLISITSFAALSKDTLGPNGGLTGGAFPYWLQEILVPQSLPVENNLFANNQKLENPTVKKTRRLAESDGTQVAIGKDGKLGIGTDTPSQLLEISGDTPRVLISSASENPELAFATQSEGEKNTAQISFDKSEKNLIFKNKDKAGLKIDESGTANARYEVQENGVTAVTADQKCEQGFFVQGFLDDGSIDCGSNSQ